MIQAQSVGELAAHGLDRISVACGTFDGVHIGHQAILNAAHAAGEETDASPVVLTFSPHPRAVIRPDTCPPLLISEAHKQLLMKRLGMAATVTVPFDEAMSQLSAHDFIRSVLLAEGLATTSVCVGSQWRFGHKATGTLSCLRTAGENYGFESIGIDEVSIDGATVSSTRIRAAITAGNLNLCERLLGRPFSICGEVGHGKGIASSELNYPTANIIAGNGAYPPAGIYVARAIRGEATLPGVCYLGYSPTFVPDKPKLPFVEMHIFDFSADLYGELLEVEFLHFLRADAHFEDKTSLLAQIEKDVAQCRAWHGSH
jgi:riboflavin kinase/FMN adenylyltransferase